MQVEKHVDAARAGEVRTGEVRGEEACTRPCTDAPSASRDEWLASRDLTAREREVVGLVMAGKTFQEISECLGIAPSTAKTYFQRSLVKLGVDSREQLAEQWAAHADAVATANAAATVDAAAAMPTPKTSCKDLFLAACQRTCVPTLFVLGFLLPQRIVRDGCIGWPVALGCGIGLLIAGLFGQRIMRLHADLVEIGHASPGQAALLRGLRGTVVCACATCVVLRAVSPIEAWLDSAFAFATALGAICLALCLAACPLAAGVGKEERARIEMLAHIMPCVICVLIATVQPVADVWPVANVAQTTANAVLLVVAVASAWFLLKGTDARGSGRLSIEAMSPADGVKGFGESPSGTVASGDVSGRGPLDAIRLVTSGAIPGKGERATSSIWGIIAISVLTMLGWAMAGSLGRPYTLGVPALVGVVFCCVALVLHAAGEGRGGICLLALNAVTAIAVGLGTGSLRCALVALPLVEGAFALGAPMTAKPRARDLDASDAMARVNVQALDAGLGSEKMQMKGIDADLFHGPCVKCQDAGLVSAGVAAVLAPPIASLYHALATASQTRKMTPTLFIVLMSIVGCAVLLPELSSLLSGPGGRHDRVHGGDEAAAGSRDLAEERNDASRAVTLLASHGLSETQVAVLAAVYEGKTSREIANELALSRGAINSARRDGYRALGVHSAEDLRRLIDESKASR